MLKDQYPNIEFVTPGEVVPDFYAMYSLGLFYNDDGNVNYFKSPKDPKYLQCKKWQLIYWD